MEKYTYKLSSFSSPEITQETKRSEIYSKTAIQAVKKGAAHSGSPTHDGHGEIVVKSR